MSRKATLAPFENSRWLSFDFVSFDGTKLDNVKKPAPLWNFWAWMVGSALPDVTLRVASFVLPMSEGLLLPEQLQRAKIRLHSEMCRCSPRIFFFRCGNGGRIAKTTWRLSSIIWVLELDAEYHNFPGQSRDRTVTTSKMVEVFGELGQAKPSSMRDLICQSCQGGDHYYGTSWQICVGVCQLSRVQEASWGCLKWRLVNIYIF